MGASGSVLIEEKDHEMESENLILSSDQQSLTMVEAGKKKKKWKLQVTHEFVREWGNASDVFKCQIFDAVYLKHEPRLLNTEQYETLIQDEKLEWLDEMEDDGSDFAMALKEREEKAKVTNEQTGSETTAGSEPEAEKPPTSVLHYKADVVTKLTMVGEDPDERMKALDNCRDICVSAHVCATRLQTIIRGKQAKKKVAKKRKGKK